MGSDSSDDEKKKEPQTPVESSVKSKEEKKEKPSPADDPEFPYRIASVLSYFIVLVVIGIPIWWYTTRVYRAPLPLDQMFKYELPNETGQQFGIPLSHSYEILITIVNPDPNNLELDVDGEEFDGALQPFLKHFNPIFDFVVKSQWLYLVELGAIPRKVNDHYALDEVQLPHVITPLEKKLWSHLTPRPCINLVIYVSHCDVPLFIYNKENEKIESNALYSPKWGGIHILNPDKKSCEAKKFRPYVLEVTSILANQLLKMFNVNAFDEPTRSKLFKTKTKEFENSTKRTLRSLAQLLSEINSIVISDEVARLVHSAVFNLEMSENYAKENLNIAALSSAQDAFQAAERAFTDPSLLALLYFPDDQKYAVYIPLFLPVMIPVLMSLITARKWYLRRKNAKVKVN